MGNTDTLHPNSCFCSFSIPTSRIKFLLLVIIMCCKYTVCSGIQEWLIQIPSIQILVSVLFPSLHLKYFRVTKIVMVMSVSYLTALLGRVEGVENVNRRLLRFLFQQMNRTTRAQTRPSAITTIPAALTVPAIIIQALLSGTGEGIVEAAIVTDIGVRISMCGVSIGETKLMTFLVKPTF